MRHGSGDVLHAIAPMDVEAKEKDYLQGSYGSLAHMLKVEAVG